MSETTQDDYTTTEVVVESPCQWTSIRQSVRTSHTVHVQYKSYLYNRINYIMHADYDSYDYTELDLS